MSSLTRLIRSLLNGLLVAAIIILSGCLFQPKRTDPESASRLPYRPPTIVPAAVVMTQTPTADAHATPTIECTDKLVFVSDVTIPDGTEVGPGSTLDKRWEIENAGTCNWNIHYHLRLLNGDAMGVPKQQSLYPARAGTRPVIRIVFKAPSKPGQYRSAWQAYNAKDQPFGDPFFIQIVVKDKS
jgi:hypothetical protein